MYKIVQTAYFPIDSHKHSLIYNNLSFNISKLFLSFCKLSLFNSGVREPENIGSDRVYFFFSLKIWNKTLHPSIANLNVIFPPCSIFRNFRIFSGNPSRSRWSRVPGDFRILARLSTVWWRPTLSNNLIYQPFIDPDPRFLFHDPKYNNKSGRNQTSGHTTGARTARDTRYPNELSGRSGRALIKSRHENSRQIRGLPPCPNRSGRNFRPVSRFTFHWWLALAAVRTGGRASTTFGPRGSPRARLSTWCVYRDTREQIARALFLLAFRLDFHPRCPGQGTGKWYARLTAVSYIQRSPPFS